MKRKLTVILASDVAGYSRLVAEDEEDVVRRFQQAATAFSDLVQKHQGRVFNTAGDAILAEFASAVDATRCALAIQDANNAQNAAVPAKRKILFRIGIAVGDVLVAETGDLLGDAVNIAARLEGIAEPGSICVSGDVVTHVQNKIPFTVLDLGEQSLRNIDRRIRAFRLLAEDQHTDARTPEGGPRRRHRIPSWPVLSAMALLTVAITGLLIWKLAPFSPDMNAGAKGSPFDAANVPMVTDRVRNSLSDFTRQPDFKAIAISRIGWGVASGMRDQVSAEREALEQCRKRDEKGDCRIYAVGDKVVWPSLLLPLAADLRSEPLNLPVVPGELAGVKGMPTVAGLEAYLNENNHKALAISDNGFSSMKDRESQAEAIRLAVERCSDFARAPCVLVSVDGFLSGMVPRMHGTVRPYTLAGETEMSVADKERIGQIYQGKDWRALARGGSKKWYAVQQMESETAAVDQVLKLCHNSEQDCRLWAIGNFRVANNP